MSDENNPKFKITKEGEEILKYCKSIEKEVNEVVNNDSRLKELSELG